MLSREAASCAYDKPCMHTNLDNGDPSRRPLNGACGHYIMVSKIQWKPFWLAIQLCPQNDWTGWLTDVDLFAQASLL